MVLVINIQHPGERWRHRHCRRGSGGGGGRQLLVQRAHVPLALLDLSLQIITLPAQCFQPPRRLTRRLLVVLLRLLITLVFVLLLFALGRFTGRVMKRDVILRVMFGPRPQQRRLPQGPLHLGDPVTGEAQRL